MPVAQGRSGMSFSIEPPTQRQLTWWFDGSPEISVRRPLVQIGNTGRKCRQVKLGEAEVKPRIPWHGHRGLAVDPVVKGKHRTRWHIVVYRQHVLQYLALP